MIEEAMAVRLRAKEKVATVIPERLVRDKYCLGM
jgi:hypothetical protein